MKKIGLVALFALLLAGCDDGGEKKAQENLRKAEAALEKENFNEAKLQIDSIRILYPKAFEARKQGVKLMQQVDLKRLLSLKQTRNKNYQRKLKFLQNLRI